jgi:predicted amidohydrolase YtcJ
MPSATPSARGKAADFVVLDLDLLTMDPERIPDVQILRAILGGL